MSSRLEKLSAGAAAPRQAADRREISSLDWGSEVCSSPSPPERNEVYSKWIFQRMWACGDHC